MKIGITSDLHIDNCEGRLGINATRVFLDVFKAVVSDNDLNVVLIAGDLSQDIHWSSDLVCELNRIVPTLWVPGNHEFWCADSSAALRFAATDENCLVDKVKVINGVQFVGTTGWYNYKFASVPTDVCRNMHSRLWGDRYCHWGRPNEDVHDEMLSSLKRSLKSLDANLPTVAVTHVIPFREAMTYKSESSHITDGYMGSPELGELLVKHQVDLSVFGHTHICSVGTVDGVDYVCSPVGYVFEWEVGDEFAPKRAFDRAFNICEFYESDEVDEQEEG